MIGTGSLRTETCLLYGESGGEMRSVKWASLTLWTLRPGQGLDLIVTHWAAWEPHTGFIESESIQEDWQCGSVGLGPSCADPVTWLQFPVIGVKGRRRELTPQRCSLTSKAHTCTPTHVHYTHTVIKNEINKQLKICRHWDCDVNCVIIFESNMSLSHKVGWSWGNSVKRHSQTCL